MKPENAIEVHHITKKFRVYLDRGKTLKELALFRSRRRYEERIVLNDISFEVAKGEAIGLIGQNGCGKSTTLKLLTKIMYPDNGSIEMRGRVSSLIELGAGFHPDMSGRQNIYTNASIFGLTRKEIEKRVSDIIAFSELEEFIDNPVRTYSSGMYTRLAFAVAINVDADILLIDEILAVGDAGFQSKCFDKLREIKKSGTTIVIVSHSLGQIEQICERSIWIHDGKIRKEGHPRDIHPQYLEYMGQKRQDIKAKERKEEPIKPEVEQIRVTEAMFLNHQGEDGKMVRTGEPASIHIRYETDVEQPRPAFCLGIYNRDNVLCFVCDTMTDQIEGCRLEKKGVVRLDFKALPLQSGRYTVDFKINDDSGLQLGFYKDILTFEMYSEKSEGGVVRLEHEWKIS